MTNITDAIQSLLDRNNTYNNALVLGNEESSDDDRWVKSRWPLSLKNKSAIRPNNWNQIFDNLARPLVAELAKQFPEHEFGFSAIPVNFDDKVHIQRGFYVNLSNSPNLKPRLLSRGYRSANTVKNLVITC